jgi:hypothetical protein
MKQIRIPKFRAPQISMPKLRGKQARAPRVGGPKIRTPKLRGPQVRTPQFVDNLYRDMRDRRLLLPAAVLLVALIAVPVVLKSNSSTAPPPPAAASAGKATAAEPAVLTRQLGVTNYRKRLDAFKSKNPFRQHFTSLPGSAKLSTSSSLDTSSSTTTTSSSTSTTSPSTLPSSTSSPTTSSSPTSSSISSSPTGSTSPSTTNNHTHHHKPILFYVKRQIDVKVGPQGNVVEKDGVKQLSFLPNGASPLVAYLGSNEAATRAFFQVSSDVTSATGDGRCFPAPSACQFLVLKKGDVETFDYSPDPGTPYKLKLLAIRNVVTRNLGGRHPHPKSSAGPAGAVGPQGSITPQG